MPELDASNYEVLKLWQYLNGQYRVHTLKGEGKNDYDNLVALDFHAVQFLFDIFNVQDRQRTFRKLHALCDFLYNKKEIEPTRHEAKKQFGSFMGQLMKNKK